MTATYYGKANPDRRKKFAVSEPRGRWRPNTRSTDGDAVRKFSMNISLHCPVPFATHSVA